MLSSHEHQQRCKKYFCKSENIMWTSSKMQTFAHNHLQDVKILNICPSIVSFRLESCVCVWNEAPAASSPPPARPLPPARGGALAGQPRSVLTLQEEVTSILGCCAVALVVRDGRGRAGSFQLVPSLLLREKWPLSGSNQNKVLGLLLKLYQMLASKNAELAAVYQPVVCRQAEFFALLKG